MADFSYYIDQHVCVVQIKGPITLETIPEISAEMKPLIEEIKKGQLQGIVMDCKQVKTIDSAGFGGICAKFIAVKKAGKKLRVVNLSETTKSFFEVCELSQTFETHRSVAALVQSMTPRAETFKIPEQIGNWKPSEKKTPPPEKSLKGFGEDLKTVILKPQHW